MAPDGDSVADLEAHEILTDLQGTDVSRASATMSSRVGGGMRSLASWTTCVRRKRLGRPALESKLV
jgi:hypothetical protein